MEELFAFKKSGTTIRREILAGFTTFFTMSYIMFVNPAILSQTGMNWYGVFVATILVIVIGTLIMGLGANVPYAVAPGMGLNAFFTYTVCLALGFAWQEALAMVFICGLINVLITITRIRKAIIRSIPRWLQLAIGGGIGLFIAYIGIRNAGFLQFTVTSPGLTPAAFPGAFVVPGLAYFNAPGPILALVGLVVTIALMLLKVKAALLIGITATTLIGIPMGVTQLPEGGFFDLSLVLAGFNEVSFAFMGEVGIVSLFGGGLATLPVVLIVIFSFSLVDIFDTVGTFIGTGRRSGIFDAEDEKAMNEDQGINSRLEKALFADSTATSIGALLGTSNATTYIESAAGISVGGRTGFTSVVVAALFLVCLPLAPFLGIVPTEAIAPALIVVGILMVESFSFIRWNELGEAIPSFFTIVIMTLAFNISWGIAAGFIFYCITMICRGKPKEIHPIILIAALLFILNFALLAINEL